MLYGLTLEVAKTAFNRLLVTDTFYIQVVVIIGEYLILSGLNAKLVFTLGFIKVEAQSSAGLLISYTFSLLYCFTT